MDLQDGEIKHTAVRPKFKFALGSLQVPVRSNGFVYNELFASLSGCLIILCNVLTGLQECVVWTEEQRDPTAFLTIADPLSFCIASTSRGLSQLKVIVKDSLEMVFRLTDPSFTVTDLASTSGRLVLCLSQLQAESRLQIFVPGDISPLKVLRTADFFRVQEYGFRFLLLSASSLAVYEYKDFLVETQRSEPKLQPGESLVDVAYSDTFQFKGLLVLTNRALFVDGRREESRFVLDQKLGEASCLCWVGKYFIAGFRDSLTIVLVYVERGFILQRGAYQVDSSRYGGIVKVNYFRGCEFLALVTMQGNIKEGPSWSLLRPDSRKLIMLALKLSIFETFKKLPVNPFIPVNCSPHKGPVLKTERSPGRSLLVSLGAADRTLNVFSINGAWPRVLFSYTFEDQPLTFSLHPLSFQLAIGFRDSLKIYLLLPSEPVLLHKESTAPLQIVQYSPAGDLLVTVSGSLLNVYLVRSMQKLQPLSFASPPLRLQFQNHMFKYSDSLTIPKRNPFFLPPKVAISTAGRAYYIDLLERRRLDLAILNLQEKKPMEVRYEPVWGMDLISFHEPKFIVCYRGELVYEGALKEQLSEVYFCHELGLVVLGTVNGYLRLDKWPVQNEIPPQEVKVHDCRVTSITVSSDLKYIISSAVDGSIVFLELQVDSQEDENFRPPASALDEFELSYLPLEQQRNSLLEDSAGIKRSAGGYLDQFLAKMQSLNEEIALAEKKNLEEEFQRKCASKQRKEALQQSRSALRARAEEELDALDSKYHEDLKGVYQRRKALEEELKDQTSRDKLKLARMEAEGRSLLSAVEQECKGLQSGVGRRLGEAEGYRRENEMAVALFEEEQREMMSRDLESQQQEYRSLCREMEKHLIEKEQTTVKRRREFLKVEHKREWLQQCRRDLEGQTEFLRARLADSRGRRETIMGKIRASEGNIRQLEEKLRGNRVENINLMNIREVFEHILESLEEERGPLHQYLLNLGEHFKTMSKNLEGLSELNAQLRKQEAGLSCELRARQLLLRKLKSPLNYASRLELLIETNFTVAFSSPQQEWLGRARQVYETFFKPKVKVLERLLRANNLVFDLFSNGEDRPKSKAAAEIEQSVLEMKKYREKEAKLFQNYEDLAIKERFNDYLNIVNFNINLLCKNHILKEGIERKKKQLERNEKKLAICNKRVRARRKVTLQVQKPEKLAPCSPVVTYVGVPDKTLASYKRFLDQHQPAQSLNRDKCRLDNSEEFQQEFRRKLESRDFERSLEKGRRFVNEAYLTEGWLRRTGSRRLDSKEDSRLK